MPPAMQYDPNDAELRDAAQTELRVRREQSTKAWQYYDGQQRKHLKIDPNGVDDNVTINVSQVVVDRTVSFRVPSFPDLELDELKDTEAERQLRAAWKWNGGARFLTQLVQTGCIDGHVFVRVIPQEPGVLNPDGFPRLVALDPANVCVFWAADDYSRVLWYEIHWSVGKTSYRQDIVDLGGEWEIYQYKKVEKPTGVAFGQDGNWPPQKTENVQQLDLYGPVWERMGTDQSWPYPLGPICDWQHLIRSKAYYGKPDLTNLQLNDRVNKITSDNSRIVRFHASPKTIGTGVGAAQVTSTAVENFWTIENPDAKVYNLEMQSELTAAENLAARLTSAFYAQHRVVVLTGSVADFQRVTNLGIRALYFDQLEKNDQLGWQYEKGIEAVSQRMRMLSGEADFLNPVKVVWADPLPTDPLEKVQELQGERDLGVVSKQTMAADLGRNWDQEKERMDEEGQMDGSALEFLMRGSAGSGNNMGDMSSMGAMPNTKGMMQSPSEAGPGQDDPNTAAARN